MLDPRTRPGDRLICALDVTSRSEALALVAELGDLVGFYKVGLQLFVAEGMPLVRELAGRGKRIFLDLKMDDIDETIKLAVHEVAATGAVELMTLLGDAATARAAVAGRGERATPRLLQVTALSSRDQSDLAEIKLIGPGCRFSTLEEYVGWRARRSLDSGCDGVIASGPSVLHLRELHGPDFLIVCPGIRPAGSGVDDHKRVNSPAEALRAGADYLVVGRPIRDAADRPGAARRIIDEMRAALDAPRAGPGRDASRA